MEESAARVFLYNGVRRRRYSDQEVDSWGAYMQAGHTVRETSAHFGVSRGHLVARIRALWGYVPYPPRAVHARENLSRAERRALRARPHCAACDILLDARDHGTICRWCAWDAVEMGRRFHIAPSWIMTHWMQGDLREALRAARPYDVWW
jgi:hypothetical protein